MCRSIVTLRGPQPAPPEEVEAAALQYVRKVAGSRRPSRANQAAFDKAVREVSRATSRLLDAWISPAAARQAAGEKAATGG